MLLSNFHPLGSRCPTTDLIMYILLAILRTNSRMIPYLPGSVKMTLGIR